MSRDLTEVPHADPLDRTIDLTAVRWASIAALVALITGVALRLAQLDQHALSRIEARWAYDAYRFYRGDALAPGESYPTTAPIALVSNAVSFFLFGVTDATARLAGALFGIGTLVLTFGLRPFVTRAALAGMIALMAISPTLVYFSRTDVATSAGVFALMLTFVALLRAGVVPAGAAPRLRWPLLVGTGLGLAFASGPASLSALIALAVGVAISGVGTPVSPARAGLKTIVANRSLLVAAIGAFLVTTITLFSRFFTSIDALGGIWTTIRDWGRMLGTTATTTPGQFFVLAIGLYELMAIVFAIVTLFGGRDRERNAIGPGVFGGWFLAALVIFSLSSGRGVEQTAYIVLPLLLLGGIGLGETVARVDPFGSLGARGWAFVGAALGTAISFLALLILAGRIDDATDSRQAWLDLLFVLVVVFLPLLVTAIYIARADREATGAAQAGAWVLFVAAILLSLTTLRAATQLSFANANTSKELLAQQTSTGAVEPLVNRIRRLSLDNTRTDGTIEDPTGGHGLTIAIDRRISQPFAWYFRDFPNLTITAEGQAAQQGADIVIGRDETGFVEGGYSAQPYNTTNRVPGAYTAPDVGAILAGIFNPAEWRNTRDYLLYRELDVPAAPESVVLGLTSQLAKQIMPDTGPYGLFERIGPGTARGQFDGPRGVASAPGGHIYVVDSGNARIQVFDSDGQFLTVWDAQSGSAQLTLNSQGLGPTGITVGSDGLVYVADTWGHRILILDGSGNVIREFGRFADNLDSTDPDGNPGSFFGPRAVAVTTDEIFVVDTGNERVQVFGRDGSFKRAFGGHGSEPGQLLEPVGIAIGPDGLIYVADSGNGRINIFTQDGAPVAQWDVGAWSGYSYFEPYLLFGPDGLLYATSSMTGSVEVFGRDGALLGSITTSGAQSLGRPSGIGMAADGSLMLTDIGNSGVYRLDSLPVEDLEAVRIGGAAATPEVVVEPVASPAGTPIP